MKISACLITKNEELNIARCINSFKDAVDEIILVDTGSIDGTVKIAKRLGARVYYFKWNNNFADARNYALKQAKGHWIVFLDADEYFYGSTGQNLRSVVKTVHPERQVDAIECRFLNLGEDGDKITGSDYLVRIFRNEKQIRYRGQIHEHLYKNEGQIISVRVGDDQIFICHTGYSSALQRDCKATRNLELLLDDLNKGQGSPQTHAYLAITYYEVEDWTNVIKHSRVFLDSGAEFSQTATVYRKLICAMIYSGYKPDEIYPVIDSAVEKFPEHPDLYYTLGQVLFREKKYNAVLQAFEMSFNTGMKFNDRESASWPSYLPDIYATIGFIHDLRNDIKVAEDYYVKALRENKGDVRTLITLIRLDKNRKTEYIIKLLRTLYNENSVQDVQMLVSISAQLRNRELFRYYYNIWKYKFGQGEDLRAFVLYLNGEYGEACKHFIGSYALGKKNISVVCTVVSALLSQDQSKIHELEDHVDFLEYKKLIEYYSGNKLKASLNNEDIDCYLLVLSEFFLLEDGKQIPSWLKLKEYFNTNISFVLGEHFLSAGFFERALEQFYEASNDNYPGKQDLYFKIGFCLFKILDYKNSVIFMNKALEAGYQGSEIHEFLRWAEEKSNQ